MSSTNLFTFCTVTSSDKNFILSANNLNSLNLDCTNLGSTPLLIDSIKALPLLTKPM